MKQVSIYDDDATTTVATTTVATTTTTAPAAPANVFRVKVRPVQLKSDATIRGVPARFYQPGYYSVRD